MFRVSCIRGFGLRGFGMKFYSHISEVSGIGMRVHTSGVSGSAPQTHL